MPKDPSPSAIAELPQSSGEWRISGAAGAIEAAVDYPEPDQARAGIAVVCHPHPLQEGSMHNKVVTMLVRSLRELGITTVRFNFRGVGASEGQYDNGAGEAEDTFDIACRLMGARPGHSLWLAGFSFGSYVAARAAQELPVSQLITVAPAVENFDFGTLKRPACPWLVIQGEEDEVVSPQAVFDWAQALRPPAQLIRMPETGHFFHRRLMDLRGAVKNAVKGNLPPPLASDGG